MEKVYAVILNYNSAGETVALYNNLKETDYEDLEVLVIDNASSITDRNNLKKNLPSEKIIFNSKNLGYAGGNNLGLEKALQDKINYIWILNPDIRVEQETLSSLIACFERDDSLAAVSPRLIKRENPKLIFSDGERLIKDQTCNTFHKNHNNLVSKTPGKIDYEVDYLDGSCILIRKEALEAVGLFSDKYFLYFEDTDWGFRARKEGWRLAVNSLAVAYNLTSNKNAVFHYYMMRNRVIFSKNFNPYYNKVPAYYMKLLIHEVLARLQGTYLKPFFVSRLKGLISGIAYTLFQK